MKVRHLLFVTASIALLLGFLKLASIDMSTRYSDHYSEERFAQIGIGDGLERVLSLVGQPLRIWKTPIVARNNRIVDSDVFIYSDSPIDSSYERRWVCFGPDRKVVEIAFSHYDD